MGLFGIGIFFILFHQVQNWGRLWEWGDVLHHENFAIFLGVGISFLVLCLVLKGKGKKGERL